jgi:hypothetical protein
MADPSQGRIQDFKLGGAHLKKFVGYFVWKITILRQTIIFFSNFRVGAGRVHPPPTTYHESAPVLGVSTLPFSTILIFYFRAVPTVWYFLFLF